ncbi:MAG: hypothetical protein V2A66_00660 [Pseudomonadota bacterium]
MGYRVLAVLAAAVMLAGCAAFDHDNTPYDGFSPNEVPAPAGQGIYTGYYTGDMSVDSNTCIQVSDKAGSKVKLSFDVVHKDAVINVTFEDGATASANLDGTKATLMSEVSGVRHVYYLTFGDGKVDGTAEAIEGDSNGQFGSPCVSYTIALAKGEKPPSTPGATPKLPNQPTTTK